MISLIAAIDENYLIGNKNKLPWNNSDDLKLFKEITINNIIIMGRKTYDSIGRILPSRINIVISRTLCEDNSDLSISSLENKVIVCSSLENAIKVANEINIKFFNKKEIYVIGGEQIYKEALRKEICNFLYISHIKGEYDGDTYFPCKDFSKYEVSQEKKYEEFTFRKYCIKK